MTRAHSNVWLTTLVVLWLTSSPPASAHQGAAVALPTPRLYVRTLSLYDATTSVPEKT